MHSPMFYDNKVIVPEKAIKAFPKPTEKAEALNNFTLLDVHRWSDFPEVNGAVDAIYDDLKHDPDFRGNEKLKKKHIKVVILDLYAAWRADRSRYIAFSRSKNSYKGGSRYNRLHISFLTVAVVDALHRRGFAEHHIGFMDRKKGEGRVARMRATDKLIQLINHVPEAAIQRYKGTECIILRDIREDRNVDIEYEDTAETRRMRDTLTAYNDLLAKTDIALPNVPARGIPNKEGASFIKPDFTAKFVRRIFNNGSWNEGGRFYGGWWQRISSYWRVRISIDGSDRGSVEVDYSGHHIVLLYAILGIDYWKADRADPYRVHDFEPTERVRALLKLVLLVIINAKNKGAALAAIRWEINLDPDEYGWMKGDSALLNDIVDAFVVRHRPIRQFFYSNYGVKLQRLDSEIAERIINRFTERDIPVLCVHDSFVIKPGYENDLVPRMNEAIWEVTRDISNVRLDITPHLKIKTIDNIY